MNTFISQICKNLSLSALLKSSTTAIEYIYRRMTAFSLKDMNENAMSLSWESISPLIPTIFSSESKLSTSCYLESRLKLSWYLDSSTKVWPSGSPTRYISNLNDVKQTYFPILVLRKLTCRTYSKEKCCKSCSDPLEFSALAKGITGELIPLLKCT